MHFKHLKTGGRYQKLGNGNYVGCVISEGDLLVWDDERNLIVPQNAAQAMDVNGPVVSYKGIATKRVSMTIYRNEAGDVFARPNSDWREAFEPIIEGTYTLSARPADEGGTRRILLNVTDSHAQLEIEMGTDHWVDASYNTTMRDIFFAPGSTLPARVQQMVGAFDHHHAQLLASGPTTHPL